MGLLLLKENEISKWQLQQELSLVFVSAKESQKINFQFRQKKKPTDVLSFASDDPGCLGELILCPAVLKEQAMDQKHSYQLELAYMITHGVLHLLGYDHEKSAKEAKKMFQLQDKLFAAIRNQLA